MPGARFIAGDHLSARRQGFTHHGIYVGDGRVVEFGGEKHAKAEAQVQEVSLAEFERNCTTKVVRHDRPPRLAMWAPTALPREECVERARFLLKTAAPGRYNLFGHNCEHAATWCANGFPESHQVRVALHLNAVRSTVTGLITAWLVGRSRRIPAWIPVTMLLFFAATTQYHHHQGRFTREIDRAWRAYKSSLG